MLYRVHAYFCKIIPASNCCAVFSCEGRKEVLTDPETVGVCMYAVVGNTIKPIYCIFFPLQNHVNERFRSATFYIYFVLLIVELILSCFKEKPPFFSPANTDPVSTSVLLYIYVTISCLESSLRIFVTDKALDCHWDCHCSWWPPLRNNVYGEYIGIWRHLPICVPSVMTKIYTEKASLLLAAS